MNYSQQAPLLDEQAPSNIKLSKEEKARLDFLKRYPFYAKTTKLDELRDKEFGRIDQHAHTYLDFLGGNLYSSSQVEAHADYLKSFVLGNPSSVGPTSTLSKSNVERARQHVLDYFKANDNYYCIFTPSATAAVKLLGEVYPFNRKSQLLLTEDNHSCMDTLRAYARKRLTKVHYAPVSQDDLRLEKSGLMRHLQWKKNNLHNLFAYPAQSNASGVKHSLEWVKIAQSNGWDVLLDATAFAPTNSLNLSLYSPDFVAISFYKMFSYPTGIGCLLIKKSTFPKLRKPILSEEHENGFRVDKKATPTEEDYRLLEGKTLNYLGIPAIRTGLEWMKKIGMERIQNRINALTAWLLDELQTLKHSNGQALLKIHGPKNTQQRGAILSMNFLNDVGEIISSQEIEQQAVDSNLSLCLGGLCNPGIHAVIQQDNECSTAEDTVRISLGYISNFGDVYRYVEFCRNFLTTNSQRNKSRKMLAYLNIKT